MNHKSDCAQHNEPYMENGPCDCGAEKKTKKVHFKDGTSIVVEDGITWEYENDPNWSHTI